MLTGPSENYADGHRWLLQERHYVQVGGFKDPVCTEVAGSTGLPLWGELGMRLDGDLLSTLYPLGPDVSGNDRS